MNSHLHNESIAKVDQLLKNASASDLLHRLHALKAKMIVSTSFGPNSAVLLKLVSDIAPDTPIIWVDSGHNTASTYRFVEQLTTEMQLNLYTYHPKRSVAHREAIHGDIPTINDAYHPSFAEEVKLEPFRRALREHQPRFWINGIRRNDSEYRKSLDVVTAGPFNTIKVAPLFYWSDEEMTQFLAKHKQPDETHYFDPTKALAGRECGLHCQL